MASRYPQETPLLEELVVAIDRRRPRAVQKLLERGVDVNAPLNGFDGPRTPFQRAIAANAPQIALMLLDAGARLERSDMNLVWAAGTGRADVVRQFVEGGADVNLKTSLGTPIQVAARGGFTEIVRLLIDAGADVNAGTMIGNALQNAVEHNHTDAALLLLDAGASLDVPWKKEFLFKSAEEHGNGVVLDALRKAEANPKEPSAPRVPGRRTSPPAAPPPPVPARDADLPDWLPDFTDRATRPAYLAAVDDLEQLCGTPRQPMSHAAGGFTFHLHSARADAFDLDRVHAEFLARGGYVFATTTQRTTIAILPTTDKYEVMLTMATNGTNYGLRPQDIVARLRELEKEQPFVLTGIGWDFLGGRFTGEIKEPRKLAEQMVALCPEIEDAETVAAELRQSSRLFFWWD